MKKEFKKGKILKGLLGQHPQNETCTIGVPKGEEGEKGPEKLFEEIVAENFPNLGKKIDI